MAFDPITAGFEAYRATVDAIAADKQLQLAVFQAMTPAQRQVEITRQQLESEPGHKLLALWAEWLSKALEALGGVMAKKPSVASSQRPVEAPAATYTPEDPFGGPRQRVGPPFDSSAVEAPEAALDIDGILGNAKLVYALLTDPEFQGALSDTLRHGQQVVEHLAPAIEAGRRLLAVLDKHSQRA